MSKKIKQDGSNETMDARPSFRDWVKNEGFVTKIVAKPQTSKR